MKELLWVVVLATAIFATKDSVYDSSIVPNATVTWHTGDTMLLMEPVFVESGAVLNIEEGVIVFAKNSSGSSAATLIICRGARIYATGTKTKPIIFTSILDDLSPGGGLLDPTVSSSAKKWGGVVILGSAPVCGGSTTNTFEGFANEERAYFGGNNSHDTSGILKYVSIRYGATEVKPNQEINLLTFCGVGDGTVVDYVEVFCGGDDGFEWFGGTVNCKHLIAVNVVDDLFDTDMGYTGNGQFWIGIETEAFQDPQNTNMGEHTASGCDNTGDVPFNISNLTFLGGKFTNNLHYYENTGAALRIVNSIFWNDGSQILMVGDEQQNARKINEKKLLYAGDIFWSPDSAKVKQYNGEEFAYWNAGNANYGAIYDMLSDVKNSNVVINPQMDVSWNMINELTGKLDPRPVSPHATSNLYPVDSLPNGNGFFEKVNYKGAFDPDLTNRGTPNDTGCWWHGWTAVSLYGYLEPWKKQPPPPDTVTIVKQGFIRAAKSKLNVVSFNKNTLSITAQEDANVRIVSMQGRVIKSFTVKRGVSSNPVNLLSGNYLAEIKSAKKVETALFNVIK